MFRYAAVLVAGREFGAAPARSLTVFNRPFRFNTGLRCLPRLSLQTSIGVVALSFLLAPLAWAGETGSQGATSIGAVAAKTRLISRSSEGMQGNSHSRASDISSQGRFIAFVSGSTNLVSGDDNKVDDIFLRDRRTGKTQRVSVSSSGTEANAPSSEPAISAGGRIIAFTSEASNLVRSDRNGERDVFIHNRKTDRTRRISLSSTGGEGNGISFQPAVSADGRKIAFTSDASNLVKPDANSTSDIFVRILARRRTKLVSVSSQGERAESFSAFPAISGDGRIVSFTSFASNLVPRDRNEDADVFVRNLAEGMTARVSVASNGREGDGGSDLSSALSFDGRFVAFDSAAENLVPRDDNGFYDVFVRDRALRETTRVSVDSGGRQRDVINNLGGMSAGGQFVAFDSEDGNSYVHDRLTATTTVVGVAFDGDLANDQVSDPAISADGRFVTFTSVATNLIPRDENGDISDVFLRGPLLDRS
jgi:Tol biopolymer transport system component